VTKSCAGNDVQKKNPVYKLQSHYIMQYIPFFPSVLQDNLLQYNSFQQPIFLDLWVRMNSLWETDLGEEITMQRRMVEGIGNGLKFSTQCI
jgi:hypothetical protein